MIDQERPVVFRCAGEILNGILHMPARHSETGVVIVVGGPQYRVGSHRQFVHLGRGLAEAGFPVFRFDCRGMGDSSGESPGFENCMPDISSAVKTFREEAPEVRQIALWGLCDGASAISIFGARDPIVKGMALVNPWVRSDEGLARAQVKGYYGRRAVSSEFWKKMLSGNVDIGRRLREFWSTVNLATRKSSRRFETDSSFQARMADGLRDFAKPVLLILSERDITAAEFETYTRPLQSWKEAFEQCSLSVHRIPNADHTFSTGELQTKLLEITIEWVSSL